jgi:hypothetical protein
VRRFTVVRFAVLDASPQGETIGAFERAFDATRSF